ncbi:MAG: HEAT repeat domain-containing protein [Ekhidna sp.]|uniref:HEAT repeat domain-containing protein n=1 Tax=Ekhidna sp. TaxID=2608089 RepID=UPI0032EFA3C4
MKITKKRAQEMWQDKVAGNISDNEAEALNQFLEANPEIAAELKELEQTWDLFEEIKRPEPSEAMDARFEGMIAAYAEKQKEVRPNVLDWIVTQMTKSWQVGLASLVMGLFIGWWMLPSQNQKEDIAQLSSEIQSMKEMMMLTLIERPKAQERIRAVNMAAELPKADEKVINALISTLNHDENLNVRLASLESLLRYADKPEVRHALVDALKMQESPLVLVAIADVLVAIQEKSSVEAMEQLEQSTEDEIVKEKLHESIQTLKNT